ncbi:MAG: hypothetical protein JOY90_28740 [Bradyrhizobium sp.]|uniref:hypothetical protein n=1 Tax=Bradyrhizobium sp. TaxID=376 RepID=UPI001D288B18|nr:hypothetical protein [Bradyrhizobium sp.]MBV9564396.1 hypothetical protein [Bradyrhizobium sp.]
MPEEIVVEAKPVAPPFPCRPRVSGSLPTISSAQNVDRNRIALFRYEKSQRSDMDKANADRVADALACGRREHRVAPLRFIRRERDF